MKITADMVKELRKESGVGMMDCKEALVECKGDFKKAGEYLREKGLLKASKKSTRAAKEGVIDSYIHIGSKIGVLLEINCETDFVAKNEVFKNLAHDISLHIAAAAPLYISKDDVPGEVIEKEKEIYKKQALNEGKPLNQLFVKDNDITIEEFVKQNISKIGENIVIKRFTRYVLGEKS